MEIIANTIEEAVKMLNQTRDSDFQIDEDQVIEYPINDEDSISWSYEIEKHNISGKTIFRFYC